MADHDERQSHRRRVYVWAALFALIVLAIVGSYVLWEVKTRRQLAHAIDQWKRAGEPIEVDDFAPRDLPDDRNAAVVYRRAGELLNRAGNPYDKADLRLELPLSAADLKVVEAYVQQNAAALAEVRKARAMNDAEWGESAAAWINLQGNPPYNRQREIANLLGMAALAHAQQGDEAAAVENVRDILHHARGIAHITPTLVCELVASGCRGIAKDRVEQIALLPADQVKTPASDEQLGALIAELLDESAAKAGWKRAMQGERAMQLNFGRNFVSKSFPAPAARQQLLLMLDTTTRLMEIGTTMNWQEAAPLVKSMYPPPPKIATPVSKVAELTYASLARPVKSRLFYRAERQMAAIALAIHWYAREHGGAMPDDLQALVPKYLPSLPADPFATDGRTYGYLPKDEFRRVYSVGDNGVDDSGSLQRLEKKSGVDVYGNWWFADAPTFLTRQGREHGRKLTEPPADEATPQ